LFLLSSSPIILRWSVILLSRRNLCLQGIGHRRKTLRTWPIFLGDRVLKIECAGKFPQHVGAMEEETLELVADIGGSADVVRSDVFRNLSLVSRIEFTLISHSSEERG
jgi:hypothetical protein